MCVLPGGRSSRSGWWGPFPCAVGSLPGPVCTYYRCNTKSQVGAGARRRPDCSMVWGQVRVSRRSMQHSIVALSPPPVGSTASGDMARPWGGRAAGAGAGCLLAQLGGWAACAASCTQRFNGLGPLKPTAACLCRGLVEWLARASTRPACTPTFDFRVWLVVPGAPNSWPGPARAKSCVRPRWLHCGFVSLVSSSARVWFASPRLNSGGSLRALGFGRWICCLCDGARFHVKV